jgi:hypothetical protein
MKLIKIELLYENELVYEISGLTLKKNWSQYLKKKKKNMKRWLCALKVYIYIYIYIYRNRDGGSCILYSRSVKDKNAQRSDSFMGFIDSKWFDKTRGACEKMLM